MQEMIELAKQRNDESGMKFIVCKLLVREQYSQLPWGYIEVLRFYFTVIRSTHRCLDCFVVVCIILFVENFHSWGGGRNAEI